MYTTLRPYATAGVAMLGASAIAIAPVVVSPVLPDIRVASPAVHLSAAIDPLTPLLDLFNKSEVNVAGLVAAWLEAPAPVLQQVIANQIGYLGQLPDIGVILEQMGANLIAALQSPFAEDLSTLEPMHASIYELIVDGIPGAIEPAPPQLVPLLEFTTTYLSGVLVGLAGLVMNPVLALGAGIHEVVQSLTGENADFAAAINTLINIPTAMVDAFLNGGQSMNVTGLLTALGLDLPVPGMEVELNFGGLLSPGGSMFNSLNLLFDPNNPADVLPGHPAGFIGSLIGLSQAIAKAIGWDGQGNPLAPPLTPQTTLREAADASILASATVTLETPATSAAAGISADARDVTPAGGADPEFTTAPVSSVTDDESDGTPAVDEDDVEVDDETTLDEETTPDEDDADVAADLDVDAGDDADETEAGDVSGSDDSGASSDDSSDRGAADSDSGSSASSSDSGSGSSAK